MSDEKMTGEAPYADPTPADVAREEPPVELTEPPVAAHPPVETSAAPDPAPPVEPVETSAPRTPAPSIVYVAAGIPPRARGNRVLGTLLALVGVVLFTVLYAGAYAVATLITGVPLATVFAAFISSALFWVPVLIFLVTFVLLVLVLNRAGWWAHVLGSLIVALIVYFASAGILMLVGTWFFGADTPFSSYLTNPGVVLAGIVAREVSIWIGLAIAARGRRVTTKNRDARAEFERAEAEKRAEHERSTTTS